MASTPGLGDMFTSPVFWRVFFLACLMSYGMYVAALVFESRLPILDVPVWNGQSKAFLPGDVGLALMVATSWYIRPGGFNNGWALLGCIVAGIISYNVARQVIITPADYTPVAWTSPSKRWHDVAMFFGFFSLALYVCIPAFFLTAWNTWALKLVGLGGLLFWIACYAWDLTHDQGPNMAQHPNYSYEPIWRGYRHVWHNLTTLHSSR